MRDMVALWQALIEIVAIYHFPSGELLLKWLYT